MQQLKPNIVLFGVDSLRADHMSCYGYSRNTTPHIDRLASESSLFEQLYSTHIPTTSAYTNMLSGMDVFSTQVVALRHKGPVRNEIKMLPEILRESGYTTVCVGFGGNAASRGFDRYIEFPGWGNWDAGRSPKAQNLNDVAIPELVSLAEDAKPFLLFMRHMDPHSPYLPPAPFERMFYHGNECDPDNSSMQDVMEFAPFADYFASWMPPGITDINYVTAQYDGAIAYMDSCIQAIIETLRSLGIIDSTVLVLNGDHGETLDEHECYFDHHGLYDPTLHVPLMIRYPKMLPAGKRVPGYIQHIDLVPTLLDLAEIETIIPFDGTSLLPLIQGSVSSHYPEMYITECTWMRKHGWRTPEWKLIIALEPDFHFKPKVELYNLIIDPLELENVAEDNPDVVKLLSDRMDRWIEKREQETGLPNPIFDPGDWHGLASVGPFRSSQQAYDSMHIGGSKQAAKLQSKTDDQESTSE